MPKSSGFPARDVLLVLVIGLLAGLLIGISFQIRAEKPLDQAEAGYTVDMAVPAVDSHGKGVATDLVVETRKGSGRTLANIDVLLFWVDTQQSIQTARSTAEEITGIDTRPIDLIYGVNAKNVSLVGGPSAGAALTIATIAALEGRQPAHDVMITGTIEDDGVIGPVGGVYEKAAAAKEAGIRMFLVPLNESKEAFTEPVENCTKDSGFVYCEKTYKTRIVDIGKELGLNVTEVADIRGALPYFFG
jgi:uncharacterized protein